jgi:regulator of PEP synthase PpsR (kinase-PPPase family)
MANPKSGGHRIVLVSDGTGETAAQMTKAALVQFSEAEHAYFTRYKNVRNEAQIEAICEDAAVNRDLVVYTIVSPQLRAFLQTKAREKSINCVDLLGPLLIGLGSYFGYEPRAIAGLLHDINESYFRRIEAVEYTVQHDDGKDFTGLDKADLVILGISRTSKTPLSMYLSHQGWKVANIPLILGFEPPKELLAIDQRRIIGLTIDPEKLSEIRRNRLERLGQNQGGDYADQEMVTQELDYANELFKKNRRWPVFNVTGKALEETASEIIRLMASRRLSPLHSLDVLPPIVETTQEITSEAPPAQPAPTPVPPPSKSSKLTTSKKSTRK